MKNAKEQLARLLEAAAAADEPVIESPSPFLEERIIAQWRSGALADDLVEYPVLFFRRALACAFAVMVIAFMWGYSGLSEPTPSHTAVAEYEMQLSLAP